MLRLDEDKPRGFCVSVPLELGDNSVLRGGGAGGISISYT